MHPSWGALTRDGRRATLELLRIRELPTRSSSHERLRCALQLLVESAGARTMWAAQSFVRARRALALARP